MAQRRVLRARALDRPASEQIRCTGTATSPTKLLATLGDQPAVQLRSSTVFLLKRWVLPEKDQRSDLSPSALDLNGSWVAAPGV